MQVIKIGGAALNDRNWLDEFAATVAVPVPNVQRLIVHGGGPDITAMSAQLGLRRSARSRSSARERASMKSHAAPSPRVESKVPALCHTWT